MGIQWTEICLNLPPNHQDAVIDFLIGLGSRGVILEGQRRPNQRLKFYFRSDEQVEEKIFALSSYLGELGLARRCRLNTRSLCDEDWNRFWQRHSISLQPIGRTLLIRAPWHEVPGEFSGRIAVSIEPSMAFGTGTHETTRHCLEFLESLMSTRGAGASFLDVGCGSGILALAASKLGARAVTAIDNDPVALDNAKKNAALNHVGGVRFLECIPTNELFDLASANIISGTLIALKGPLKASVHEGGHLILSGILNDQAKEVMSAYEGGYRRIDVKSDEPWVTILLQRSSGRTAR